VTGDRESLRATSRARDVLVLLGQRLTNAEIAERPVISVRTVESHVSSLLTTFRAAGRRPLMMTTGIDPFPAESASVAPGLRHKREARPVVGPLAAYEGCSCTCEARDSARG